MAIQYPSALDSLTRPNTSNPLNNPSHTSVHADVASAIEALEAKVGVNGSAVTTSHDYRISQLEGGAVPTFVDLVVPTGTINGSNVSFTLAHMPIAGSLHLYLNGVLQCPGAGNDYTLSGTTITMASAPETDSVLLASYRH